MITISKITTLVFALLLGISIQAQDTLLVELFDDETLGQFTEYSIVGDGEKWRSGEFSGKLFATMNGFNDVIQENIDWLVSPAIDMNNYDDEILSFENATNFDGPDLEFLISLDYSGSGDPTSATWENMNSFVNWSPGDYSYVGSGDIDLSALSGTAYIAFKYTSSSSDGGRVFQLDSIIVTATTLSSGIYDNEIPEKISAPYVSNDNLVFSVLDASSNLQISISTIDGKIIQKLSNRMVKGDINLPIGELSSGTYVLIANSNGSVMSYKFVK